MRRLAILVVVLLLVALALMVAAGRGWGQSTAVRLTPGARALLANWTESRPREQRCSGVRDGEFFEAELREPEHADVARMVGAAGGTMDVAAMGRWIVESSGGVFVSPVR